MALRTRTLPKWATPSVSSCPLQLNWFRATTSFSIKTDNGNETEFGTCDFKLRASDNEPGNVICTITDLSQIGEEKLKGKLELEVIVGHHQAVESFVFKTGTKVIASLQVPGGKIVKDSVFFLRDPFKWGWTLQNGNSSWHIRVLAEAADADGHVNLTDVMVNDQTANGFEPHLFADRPNNLRVWEHDLWQEADGTLAGDKPGKDVADDRIQLEAALDKASYTLKIKNDPNAQVPRGYVIGYQTTPAGGEVLPGDKFKNKVTVAGVTREAEVTYGVTGSGVASGESRTRFSVTKDIQGSAESNVPADTNFEVKYTVTYEENGVQKTDDGIVTINGADGTGYSPCYLRPAMFTVEEVNIPSIPGVEWDDYEFTGTGVTDNGNGTYTVDPGNNRVVDLPLTNNSKQTLTDVTVTKKWVGGPADNRPTVEFRLLANGEVYGRDGVPFETVKLENGATSYT